MIKGRWPASIHATLIEHTWKASKRSRMWDVGVGGTEEKKVRDAGVEASMESGRRPTLRKPVHWRPPRHQPLDVVGGS